ncbi:MAG: polyprenyl synthetase family protein [Bacteroidales bacterium]|nr:polyprenyl synthetase family protein [Bacteroidales bacterium]
MNLEAKLEEVHTEYLRRMTQGNGQLLHDVEHHVTSRRGKMLRPLMTLMAAATLGEDYLNSRRTLLLAVCVEMLHNASLLHDDVIDRAETRRGNPSVNAQWNNATAVLVGDYHFASIMDLLDEVDDREATRRVNKTVKAMVEAELLAQEVDSWQLPTYLRIIDGKTAQLFAIAAAFGNPAYEEFGLHYGRLFQLRDDLADGEAPPWTTQLIAKEEDTIKQMDRILNI